MGGEEDMVALALGVLVGMTFVFVAYGLVVTKSPSFPVEKRLNRTPLDRETAVVSIMYEMKLSQSIRKVQRWWRSSFILEKRTILSALKESLRHISSCFYKNLNLYASVPHPHSHMDSRADDETDTITTVRRVEPADISLKASSIPGAGNGVFAKRSLAAGTILPYYTIIQSVDSPDFDMMDDTYFMTASYMNASGKFRAINKVVANGDPSLEGLRRLRAVDRHASCINESSDNPPNCVFVNNPFITKNDIHDSLEKGYPTPITLVVVPYDIAKGSELFTMYGSDYSRGYKVWRDRKGIKDDLINVANDIVEFNGDAVNRMFGRGH